MKQHFLQMFHNKFPTINQGIVPFELLMWNTCRGRVGFQVEVIGNSQWKHVEFVLQQVKMKKVCIEGIRNRVLLLYRQGKHLKHREVFNKMISVAFSRCDWQNESPAPRVWHRRYTAVVLCCVAVKTWFVAPLKLIGRSDGNVGVDRDRKQQSRRHREESKCLHLLELQWYTPLRFTAAQNQCVSVCFFWLVWKCHFFISNWMTERKGEWFDFFSSVDLWKSSE